MTVFTAVAAVFTAVASVFAAVTSIFTAVAAENADETPITDTAATSVKFSSHCSKISFSVLKSNPTYLISFLKYTIEYYHEKKSLYLFIHAIKYIHL